MIFGFQISRYVLNYNGCLHSALPVKLIPYILRFRFVLDYVFDAHRKPVSVERNNMTLRELYLESITQSYTFNSHTYTRVHTRNIVRWNSFITASNKDGKLLINAFSVLLRY